MQVDLKPNELRAYMGINPCPEDIDSFWDGEIARMQSINPKVELRKVLDYPNAEY